MSRFVTGRSIRPGQELSQGISAAGAVATGAIIATGAVSTGNNLVPRSYINTLAAALAPPGNTNTLTAQGTCGSDAQTGTFTVPSGVSNIFVQVWGGGGGGAMNCSWKVGAPGGGGGYVHKSIAVSAGQAFCYCASGGGCGGSYPNSKIGCKGCDSVFYGPYNAGTTHCLIACGGCGGFCNGTTYGQRACGGCSTGGDLCIQGGDGHQTSCCACGVGKCANTMCYTPSIFAGGAFLGAPSRMLHVCHGMCCPGGTLGTRGCGMPFGGGGFGGISGFYSGGCACGSNGGGGAVMVWF